MALKKDMVFSGLEVKDAYIRVEKVSVLNGSPLMEVVALFSAGREHPTLKGECYIADYDPSGDGCIEQAYAHLKTLPEFEGATDC